MKERILGQYVGPFMVEAVRPSVVVVYLDRRGEVENVRVRVSSGSVGDDDHAVRTAAASRYRPASANCRNVRATYRYTEDAR